MGVSPSGATRRGAASRSVRARRSAPLRLRPWMRRAESGRGNLRWGGRGDGDGDGFLSLVERGDGRCRRVGQLGSVGRWGRGECCSLTSRRSLSRLSGGWWRGGSLRTRAEEARRRANGVAGGQHENVANVAGFWRAFFSAREFEFELEGSPKKSAPGALRSWAWAPASFRFASRRQRPERRARLIRLRRARTGRADEWHRHRHWLGPNEITVTQGRDRGDLSARVTRVRGKVRRLVCAVLLHVQRRRLLEHRARPRQRRRLLRGHRVSSQVRDSGTSRHTDNARPGQRANGSNGGNGRSATESGTRDMGTHPSLSQCGRTSVKQRRLPHAAVRIYSQVTATKVCDAVHARCRLRPLCRLVRSSQAVRWATRWHRLTA